MQLVVSFQESDRQPSKQRSSHLDALFYYLRVCLLHNQACIQAIVHQNNKKMSPSIDILKNMGYNSP
mgnify:CR=1 FL=1